MYVLTILPMTERDVGGDDPDGRSMTPTDGRRMFTSLRPRAYAETIDLDDLRRLDLHVRNDEAEGLTAYTRDHSGLSWPAIKKIFPIESMIICILRYFFIKHYTEMFHLS